mgnify:CR=1 FL=1
MLNIKNVKKGPYPPCGEASKEAAREGFVLLKNNGVLPLKKGETVSVFGRDQLNYYKSGTGSGGLVHTDKVLNIPEAIINDKDISLNQEVYNTYKEWEKENPFDEGKGWATEPWFQTQMPLSDELVEKASKETETALIIIGRLAGEARDNAPVEGSYLLTKDEEKLLEIVSKYFKKTCVILNTGNVIDNNFVEKFNIDGLMYVWQGGLYGAEAIVDVLSGRYSPSGKLADTIIKDINDCPALEDFGREDKIYYKDDIYVGYRYFETFAKDKVLYPFGFGLSYTTFDVSCFASNDENTIIVTAKVKNTGAYSGKEVVQVYYSAPSGKLGKPARELVSYAKTKELAPNEEQILTLSFDINDMASYDDSGITGNKSCYVLEEGLYEIYAGTDVRSAEKVHTYTLDTLKVAEKLTQAMAPVEKFERLGKNGFEPAPLREYSLKERVKDNLPEDIEYTGDKGIKLVDVYNGKNTLDEFIAQLSDENLAQLIRGEGMHCIKVTPGTTSGFGGLTPELMAFGIPACCTTDGPSGLRLDSGAKATSMPNGTLLACTFNKELVEKLHSKLAVELYVYDIDCLLGPGINIHRHPLNGRNFEYFSEDPYLTGTMAAAATKGLSVYKGTGTIKHFCCNNQEHKRNFVDSVVSERALREIYLKPFEIAVKEGYVKAIMTSYNPVNGIYTAANYDLNTTILRNEWGYKGFVMTDWWARCNDEGEEGSTENTKAMAIAQNDVYMCSSNALINANNDNTEESLKDGLLTRGQLQRNARNTLNFILGSTTFEKYVENGCPELKASRLDYDKLKCILSIDNFDAENKAYAEIAHGHYFLRCTYSIDSSSLAQYNIHSFLGDTRISWFAANGTEGKEASTLQLVRIPCDIKNQITFDAPESFKVIKLEFLESVE